VGGASEEVEKICTRESFMEKTAEIEKMISVKEHEREPMNST